MKNILLTLGLSALGLVLLLLPVRVAAEDVFDDVCQGVSDSVVCQSNVNQGPDVNGIYGPNGLLTKAARLLSIVIGVASIIMIIVAGFQYVTSTGDSAKLNSAKNTIVYAVAGLVVASLAQLLIIFVIGRL